MSKPSGGTDVHCTAEAISFSASVRIRFLEDCFHIFRVNVHDWAMCQMEDNCSLKKCIVDLMDIPHVGCGDQKLNMEVRAMISTDRVMHYTIDSVHSILESCKSGL